MSALVYPVAAWAMARSARAKAGRAPRHAVARWIVLRQAPCNGWAVLIHERRYGVWKKPEWLCRPTTLAAARSVVRTAWDQYRLPIAWVPKEGRQLRPFSFDHLEPTEAQA